MHEFKESMDTDIRVTEANRDGSLTQLTRCVSNGRRFAMFASCADIYEHKFAHVSSFRSSLITASNWCSTIDI